MSLPEDDDWNWMIPDGEGGRIYDHKNPECNRRLILAAEAGHPEAQRCVGAAYATGDWTLGKDLAQSMRWYRASAEQGNAYAAYMLGWMRLEGEGEPRDLADGIRWLERAVELGEEDAADFLAICYEEGTFSLPRDSERAAFWRRRVNEIEQAQRDQDRGNGAR
jgi:TPR repeat protein